MKKLFFTLSMALMSTLVFAVPAKRGLWKTVKMADGTEVRVELRGDEFCNYWQAEDGRKFVKNSNTGFFELADMDKMKANADKLRLSARRNKKNIDTRAVIGGDHQPYVGKKKGLIILVQFADMKFWDDHTPELYNRIANEEGFNEMGFNGSVKDYFKAQSYGQFELDFDIAGPVTMLNNYAYYGAHTNGSQDNDPALGEMVMDACKSVDANINFKDYDWDGDGEVDQVFILYAGHGEASWDDPNTIWPHEWNLRSAIGRTLTLDGVKIDTYACSCELGINTSNRSECIDGIGTICHEFSHCLGFADMYDTSYSGNYGMGEWDIMDQGSYNGNGYLPANYTSYERMYAGWIEPIELKENCSVNNMTPLSEKGEAYIIYNDNNSDEYYLLENRQRTGWDAGLPNSGLLILHVDFDASAWRQNIVNSTSRQRCTIFLADNDPSSRNTAGDIYPYGYNNSLTNTSTPAATLNNMNTDGSKYMNKSVKNITRNGDGTMSFTFENENNNTNDYQLPESYIFYESFDKCDGQGGNDGNFSATTSGSVQYDNDGWKSTSSRQALKCAQYGSSMIAGSVTTPEITINGTCQIQFKAAPYANEANNIYIEVQEGDGTLSKNTFVLKANTWSAYSADITGSGPCKLRFYVSSGRFYLDKVCVSDGSTTGINSAVNDNKVNDNRIFSIDGRYMGKDFNSLKKGIYIINGKKIVK